MLERSEPINARAAKNIVEDLFEIKPSIYWSDLLLSTALSYGLILIYLAQPTSLLGALAFVLAAIGLFRITTFMHEIAHFRKNHMRAFKIAWNALVGIPLLTPSLFYTTHADHHSNRHYGTANDGEYLPFASPPRSQIVRFVLSVPLVPILAVARALILVPLSLMLPRLRAWLLARASAAVISPTFSRRHPPSTYDPIWLFVDVSCFAYAAAIVFLVYRGSISLATISLLYVLIVTAIGLNWLRTLAAHRYRNDGSELSHQAQVLDSINISGHPLLTECLYPVGLRYHALHHLLPSLPYHALGSAHRRLLEELPENSLYHECSSPSTIASVRQLWRDAKRTTPVSQEAPKA